MSCSERSPPPLNCLLFLVPCSVRRLTNAGTESPSTVIRIVWNMRGLHIDLGGGRGHNTSMPAPTPRLHLHPHTALHIIGICSSLSRVHTAFYRLLRTVGRNFFFRHSARRLALFQGAPQVSMRTDTTASGAVLHTTQAPSN